MHWSSRSESAEWQLSRRWRNWRQQVLHLDYELAKANEKLKEMDELKKQNKKMDLWGKEMKKRLKQINTLSWEEDMKRNVGKD